MIMASPPPSLDRSSHPSHPSHPVFPRRSSTSGHQYAPPSPSPLSPYFVASTLPTASGAPPRAFMTNSHYYRPPRSTLTSPTRSNRSTPTGSPTRTSRQTRIQSLLASDPLLSRLTPTTIVRFANDDDLGFTIAEKKWSIRAADGIVKVGEWLREVEGWNLNWRRAGSHHGGSGNVTGRDMTAGYLPPSPDRPKKRRKLVAIETPVEGENSGMKSIKEVDEDEEALEIGSVRVAKKNTRRRLFVQWNADTSDNEEELPEVVLLPPSQTSDASNGRHPRKPLTPYQLKLQRQKAADGADETTPTQLTKQTPFPTLQQTPITAKKVVEASQKDNHCDEEEEEGSEEDDDGEEGEEYWGSLRKSTVEKYEARISFIKSEIEEFEIEALKSKVLSYRTGTTNPLTDSSAIITATTLQLLPPLHRLTKLLSLWTVRLAILRVVPVFLRWLGIARDSLDAGYAAINHPSISPNHPSNYSGSSSPSWRGLEEETYTLLQDTISQKVATAGQLMDTMLDALEGREDVLPDIWISELEDVEECFGAWEMDGERVVLEGRLRLDDLRHHHTHREELEREREKTALVLEQERSAREAEQVSVEVDGVMERAEETERGLREAMEANEVVAEGIELGDDLEGAGSPVEGLVGEWVGRELLMRLESVEKMRMARSWSIGSETETEAEWMDANEERRLSGWGSIADAGGSVGGAQRHGISLDPIRIEKRWSAISTGTTPFMTPMSTAWFTQNGHMPGNHGSYGFGPSLHSSDIAPVRSYPVQHPAAGQVHPATTQLHPSVTQVHPTTTQTHPSVTQNHPAVIQNRPTAIQTHPSVTQVHPAVIQTHPSTIQTHPSVTQSHPSVTQAHPAVIQTHPSTIQTHPSVTQSHPAVTQQHPSVMQQHPSVMQQHPSVTQKHPSVTQIHPSVTQNHPAVTQTHPSTTQIHPATQDPAPPRTPPPKAVKQHVAPSSPEIIKELPQILAAARSFFRVEKQLEVERELERESEKVLAAQIKAEEKERQKYEEAEIDRLAELEVAKFFEECERAADAEVEKEEEQWTDEAEESQEREEEKDRNMNWKAIAEEGLWATAEGAQREEIAKRQNTAAAEAAEAEHQRLLAEEAAFIGAEERQRLAEERKAQAEQRLANQEEAAAERTRLAAAAATATAVSAAEAERRRRHKEEAIHFAAAEGERIAAEAGCQRLAEEQQRKAEASRLAAAETDRQRELEVEQLAALETGRLAAEAEEKRPQVAATVEAERQRLVDEEAALAYAVQQAAEEEERRRTAEAEVERQRLIEEEAEKQKLERLAVLETARLGAEAEAEVRRAEEEDARQRGAELERLAAIETENQRITVLEIERERVIEEESRRNAEAQAEVARRAEEEAARKREEGREILAIEATRIAEEEAERSRVIQEDAERQRFVEIAALEAARVAAEEEAERQRVADQQKVGVEGVAALAAEEAERQQAVARQAKLVNSEAEAEHQINARQRISKTERERRQLATQEAERLRVEREVEEARIAAEIAKEEDERRRQESLLSAEKHTGSNSEGGSVSGDDVTEEYHDVSRAGKPLSPKGSDEDSEGERIRLLKSHISQPSVPPPSVDMTPVNSRSPSVQSAAGWSPESPTVALASAKATQEASDGSSDFDSEGELIAAENRAAHDSLQKALGGSAERKLFRAIPNHSVSGISFTETPSILVAPSTPQEPSELDEPEYIPRTAVWDHSANSPVFDDIDSSGDGSFPSDMTIDESRSHEVEDYGPGEDYPDFDMAPLATSTPKPVRRLGRLSGLDSITEVLTPHTPYDQNFKAFDGSRLDDNDTPSKRGKGQGLMLPEEFSRGDEDSDGSPVERLSDQLKWAPIPLDMSSARPRSSMSNKSSMSNLSTKIRPTPETKPSIKTQRSQRFTRKAPLDMSKPRSLSSTSDRPRSLSAASDYYITPDLSISKPLPKAIVRGAPRVPSGERSRPPSASGYVPPSSANLKALPKAMLKGAPKGALGPAMKAIRRPRKDIDSDDESVAGEPQRPRSRANTPDWASSPTSPNLHPVPRLNIAKHTRQPSNFANQVTPDKNKRLYQSGAPFNQDGSSLVPQTPKLEFPQQSLDDKVNEILTALASPVRLTASNLQKLSEAANKRQLPLRPFDTPSSIPAPKSIASNRSVASDATSFSRVGRRHVPSTPGDIKLYHLHRNDGQAPIKLYIRLVGEKGERVMVRVGGGWADLAEYLKEYATHHGSKRRVVSEGRIEIQDFGGAAHHRSLHPSRSISSLRSASPASGSRPSSPLVGNRSRSASALGFNRRAESPFGRRAESPSLASPPRVAMRGGHNGTAKDLPIAPTLPVFQPLTYQRQSGLSPPAGSRPPSRPGSSHSTVGVIRRSASRMSFTSAFDGGEMGGLIDPGPPKPLGLAGPKGKNNEISPGDQAWIEEMLGEVQKVSAGRRRRLTGGSNNGDMDFNPGEIMELQPGTGGQQFGGRLGISDMGKQGGTRRVFPRQQG